MLINIGETESITISDSVKVMGAQAFDFSGKLPFVILHELATLIEKRIFSHALIQSNCIELFDLYLGRGCYLVLSNSVDYDPRLGQIHQQRYMVSV